MSRVLPLRQLFPELCVPDDLLVSGLTQDSRDIKPGQVFLAVPGIRTHGLMFAAQARAQGASAVVYDPPIPPTLTIPPYAFAVPGLSTRLGEIAAHFYDYPARKMQLVGVTGTNGKTSVVQLLAQAWEMMGVPSATIGTLGIGRYGHTAASSLTTPPVVAVHAHLARMLAEKIQAVAMEVSSHALMQGRVDHVDFQIGVMTNLTRDHLDYHGTMAQYGQAKARLFACPTLKAAILNLDHAFGRHLFQQLGRQINCIGVSSSGQLEASVLAQNVHLHPNGCTFIFEVAGQQVHVKSSLYGRFNVDNLLAVAAVLLAQGHTPAHIGSLLNHLSPVPGRMTQVTGESGQPQVVIDYAHTPDGLNQALVSLRAHTTGRVVCVFGCGGERDRGKRAQMAAIAQTYADQVIITDDNPRDENPKQIINDILAGLVTPHQALVERQRDKAIWLAISGAKVGDSVLIAGKGHENYQIYNGISVPFDDQKVARAALTALHSGAISSRQSGGY